MNRWELVSSDYAATQHPCHFPNDENPGCSDRSLFRLVVMDRVFTQRIQRSPLLPRVAVQQHDA